MLNDEKIRNNLITHLSRMAFRPKAILQEVRVHNGNAIADIVTVHENPHCYEIKGSTDNIYKALKQSSYYEKTFKRMTLVTTLNYESCALRLMPDHWGILIAKSCGNNVVFKHARKASANVNFDKQIALHTLWKSELLDCNEANTLKGAKKLNRDQLAKIIAATRTEEELLRFIGSKLTDRATSQESR